jgi:hypothetical protein
MGLEKALHLVQETEIILEGLRLTVKREATSNQDQEIVDLEQALLTAITEVGVMKDLLASKMNT